MAKRSSARTILAVLVLFASLAVRAADPVAFLSDIRGDVAVEGAGRPSFLAELAPGAKLVLGPQASAAVMFLVNGEEFTLQGPGEFLIVKMGVRAVKGAAPKTRLAPQRASAPIVVDASKAATASLRMRSAAPSRAEAAGPQYPVNARIATLQPTLRWGGPADVSYAVVVRTSAGAEVFRGEARGNTIRLPVRLAAGQSYSWSSSADTQPPGEARFDTLPAEAIRNAERVRGATRTFTDRVVLALHLQEIGAAQDAREVWSQLAAERPDLPELAGLSR